MAFGKQQDSRDLKQAQRIDTGELGIVPKWLQQKQQQY